MSVGRECGSCSQCCKTMGIVELAKPAGAWCPHRGAAVGCSIYGSRPGSCRAFACQWLLSPDMPQKFRPDRTRVVVAAEDEGPRLVAYCDPANPLAWRREPVFSMLKQQATATWRSPLNVMATAWARLWLITPTTEIDMGEVHPRAPFEILKYPDGSATFRVFSPVEKATDVVARLGSLRAFPGQGSAES